MALEYFCYWYIIRIVIVFVVIVFVVRIEGTIMVLRGKSGTSGTSGCQWWVRSSCWKWCPIVGSFRTRSARSGSFLLRDDIVVRIEGTTKGFRVIVIIAIIIVFNCWTLACFVTCITRGEGWYWRCVLFDLPKKSCIIRDGVLHNETLYIASEYNGTHKNFILIGWMRPWDECYHIDPRKRNVCLQLEIFTES